MAPPAQAGGFASMGSVKQTQKGNKGAGGKHHSETTMAISSTSSSSCSASSSAIKPKKPVFNRKKAEIQTMKPGDWTCNICGVLNFASRGACYSCGRNRPVDQPRFPKVAEIEEDLDEEKSTTDDGNGTETSREVNQSVVKDSNATETEVDENSTVNLDQTASNNTQEATTVVDPTVLVPTLGWASNRANLAILRNVPSQIFPLDFEVNDIIAPLIVHQLQSYAFVVRAELKLRRENEFWTELRIDTDGSIGARRVLSMACYDISDKFDTFGLSYARGLEDN